MHDTGLVHWDDPEGWDGERGGRGVQDGEHMYTHGRFMLMYRSVALRSYPSSKVKGNELEHWVATAQEQWLRGAYPRLRSGATTERSLSMSEVRGGSQKENTHLQEQLLRGAGGLRGATPGSRSGEAAVRRYPSSKVRSSGCALLEQP